jgi:serine/threonine-protein kinase
MTTPQKIGRYEILEELGRGAMGAVYRAKDPAMDRVVALKTIIATALASEQGPEFRERFFREARAAGNLAHPGIVPVFDMGEHEGSPFLVMEFVNGWTLASAAARGERLDLNRMCEIGQNVAEALGYAHQRGVIHRDIKPANILITSREAYGTERPKITDFGIAKLTENEATMTGKMLGTPAFMPPEQFTGAPVDGRSDIFSLGVVLYWLATGEQPFPGEGLTAVLYKVVHTEPIPPRKLNPSLPARFESIILKCMEKDPSARYQSAEELARELSDLRNNKAATAPVAAKVFTPISDTDSTIMEPIAVVRPVVEAPDVTGSQKPVATTASAPAAPAKRGGQLIAGVLGGVVVLGAAAAVAIHLRHRLGPVTTATVIKTVPAANSSPAASVGTPAPAPAPAADAGKVMASTAASAEKPAAAAASKPSAAHGTDISAAKANTPSTMAAAPVAAASSKPSTVAPTAASAAAGKPNIFQKAAANLAKMVAPKTSSASSVAVAGVDPTKLDPKLNARLTLDSSDMPAGLQFTIEMNGKVYSRNTHGANVDLYVPPGKQQLIVTAGSALNIKSSNTVSTDFQAKKHYTLRVELHVQGQPASAGMPDKLYDDSQIVISLK